MLEKSRLFLVLLLAGAAAVCFAQSSDNHNIKFTIPVIHVLDVDNNDGTNSPGTDVTITLSDPTTPGDKPQISYENNDTYLNYTSVVAASSPHTISASLGAMLPGVNIRVSVTAPATGKGNRGNSAATNLVLTNLDQDVITGIGSCYTGTTGTSGAAVVYDITFDEDNFDDLAAANPTINVTYTISD